MTYEIKTIRNRAEIDTCPLFEITHFMWDSKQSPHTYGRMGYLPGEGFYVSMTCEEASPMAVYTNYMDPVCKDSAMEAFLAFPASGEALTNNVMYLNFEANSNGALYAAYGKGRKGRSRMPEEYLPACDCRAQVEEGKWNLTFTIPQAYLLKEGQVPALESGVEFYCNFYKISESKEIEHYGSYSKIDNPTPNFHLPVCFAKCRIVE